MGNAATLPDATFRSDVHHFLGQVLAATPANDGFPAQADKFPHLHYHLPLVIIVLATDDPDQLVHHVAPPPNLLDSLCQSATNIALPTCPPPGPASHRHPSTRPKPGSCTASGWGRFGP
ncbi:hypothetical protein ACA910_005313 [Epithemia clementina (nom. ined.)]